jgi:hypothetical protein
VPPLLADYAADIVAPTGAERTRLRSSRTCQ